MTPIRALLALVLGVALLAGLAVLAFAETPEAGESETAAAEAAALAWLALVDEGDYDASWEQAASLLKNAVTPEQWARQAGAALVEGSTPFALFPGIGDQQIDVQCTKADACEPERE